MVLKPANGQSHIKFVGLDGFKIPNVTLHIYSPFGLELRNYIDSSEGFYVLQAFNRIKATAPGYLPYDSIFLPEKPLGTKLILTMTAEPQLLDMVIISANRSGLRVQESPVSISVLRPYLIDNKITADMSQALRQVPGVDVTDNQVNIRNGSGWSYGAGSRVGILLDDLPMLSGDAGQAQFSFIPVENISGVEVVKSAGSVLYGSSALNGVVNIRSAEPETKANARVSVFTGFYGKPNADSLRWTNKTLFAHGINGFFSQKIKNTGFTISWNGLYDQGYRQFDFNNKGRLSLRIKHESKVIKGLYFGINSSIQTGKSGSFLLWESDIKGYNSYNGGYNKSQTDRFSLDPFIEKKGKRMEHKLMGRIFLLDTKNDNGDPNNDQSNNSRLIYSEYRNALFFLKRRLSINSGLVYMTAKTHSPIFQGDQHSKNIAAYTQADLKYKRLLVNAGFRYEYFQLNQANTAKPVFRFGANYHISRGGFIRASYGQGFRFPSMAEAFISTSVGPIKIYPNPEIKPETGDNAEIGFKQAYKIGKFKAYADVALYSMRYYDMTEFIFAQWGDNSQPPSFGFGFKSVNTGQTSIQGFEIETAGEGSIGNTNLQILAGYTYSNPVSVNPKYVFATDSVSPPKNLSFSNTRAYATNYLKYRYRHLFRIDLQATYKKLEVGISCRYNSTLLNMDTAFIVLGALVPGIGNAAANQSSATIFDFRVGYQISTHFKFNVQILNIANTIYMARPADYRQPRSYQLQCVWKLR